MTEGGVHPTISGEERGLHPSPSSFSCGDSGRFSRLVSSLQSRLANRMSRDENAMSLFLEHQTSHLWQ